jgi:transcription initiation factor TFIIIB Brf1 subunit/transcription initiation factor TFIIB
MLQEYRPQFAHAHSYREKKVLRELDNMDLDDCIKSTARDIYHCAFEKETRGKNRKRALFFCIFNAYNEMQTPVDPQHVAKLVGLETKSKEISKAKKCGGRNYRPKNMILKSKDFIARYCMLLGKDNDIDAIYHLANKVTSKDPSLEDATEAKPQHVAAAIIYYYYSRTGNELSKESFVNTIGISFPTIQKMVPYIAHVYETE